MPRTETLKNIPANKVDQVVADFESEGATVTTQKDNGTFTVTAVFEDDNADDAADEDEENG